MQKIVADANIEGQISALAEMMQRPPWDFYWREYQLELTTFAELNIPRDANDRVVWNAVQLHSAILITDNRNDDDEDALQSVINDSCGSKHLPVVTIGDMKKCN